MANSSTPDTAIGRNYPGTLFDLLQRGAGLDGPLQNSPSSMSIVVLTVGFAYFLLFAHFTADLTAMMTTEQEHRQLENFQVVNL